MAKGRPRRVNTSLEVRSGSHKISDYDLGWDLWYTGKTLPLGCKLATQQGYVKAAKSADKCLVSSMRFNERKGMFFFLPKWSHLSYKSGNSLDCGNESRYGVRKARVIVAQVKAAQPDMSTAY